MSPVSSENAKRNLLTEAENWNFDSYRRQAAAEWERQLKKIRIKSSDDRAKRIFYTAFYHAMLTPNLYTDTDGKTRDASGAIRRIKGYQNYHIFSLWDTYRALHPLLFITHPEESKDFLHSLILRHRSLGHIPKWELAGGETDLMTGYPATQLFADAMQKGIRFNYSNALKILAKRKSSPAEEKAYRLFKKYHYVPYFENHHERVHYEAARTLQFSLNDWALYQIAKGVGKERDYRDFNKSSTYYRNLIPDDKFFIQPKTENGQWVKVNPSDIDYGNGFIEGNSWQYSWLPVHDLEFYKSKHGGEDNLIETLITMIRASSQFVGWNHPPDVTGMLGQYAHGNEPSHHIPYLFTLFGDPLKTQKMVRKIMDQFYSDRRDGLIGNEDCGQLSAWYVFSSLGFYPVLAGSGQYVLGVPRFEEVEITLPKNQTLTVRQKGYAEGQQMAAEKMVLNGHDITAAGYFYHNDLKSGGVLEFHVRPWRWSLNDDLASSPDLFDITNFIAPVFIIWSLNRFYR